MSFIFCIYFITLFTTMMFMQVMPKRKRQKSQVSTLKRKRGASAASNQKGKGQLIDSLNVRQLMMIRMNTLQPQNHLPIAAS